MGKMGELFQQIREKELQLESLSIAQLKSLLPAYNEYMDKYIRQLINEKEYAEQSN